VAIWQHDKPVFGIFIEHARKRLFRSFRSKIGHRHSLRLHRFPIGRVYFRYPMTFTAYIWCFVHNFIWPRDLDLLPFDLGAVWRIKSLTHQTPIAILASYGNPFLSYVWLNLIILLSPGTVTAHAPCHVTYHRGDKNDPHFRNPWPKFTYSLCHVQGATTKIKPCYMRKIAFSHCEVYTVHCACAISRDLCLGGPRKPHVTIFWPRLIYSLYNFYGATMTIKGSFILEHLYFKAIFGRKKQVQSKLVSTVAFFRKFKGLHINCGHRDPQKAHPWPQRRLVAYFS